MMICWVLPALLPVTAYVTAYAMNDMVSTTTTSYLPLENGTACWVQAPWKWISFMIPCWICLVINLVVLIMIARVIIRSAKSGSSRGGHSREIKAIVTIGITVGVPWIASALTFDPIAIVGQWLFIVLTGLQGPIMFLCFVIFQTDVLTNLCGLFGKSPPDWLIAPSTRDTMRRKDTGGLSATASSILAREKPRQEVRPSPAVKEVDDEKDDEVSIKNANIYSNNCADVVDHDPVYDEPHYASTSFPSRNSDDEDPDELKAVATEKDMDAVSVHVPQLV